MPPDAVVVLVRHATSVPPVAGGPDEYSRPLSDAGRDQARLLVDSLVAAAPTRIVSSPYLRAVQTVAPTAERLQLAVSFDDGLREWRMGAEPSPDGVWQQRCAAAWADPARPVADGESLADVDLRVRATLLRLRLLAGQGGPIAAAGHGTWIARALWSYSPDRVDREFWLAMPMPAVFTLRFPGGASRPEITGPAL